MCTNCNQCLSDNHANPVAYCSSSYHTLKAYVWSWSPAIACCWISFIDFSSMNTPTHIPARNLQLLADLSPSKKQGSTVHFLGGSTVRFLGGAVKGNQGETKGKPKASQMRTKGDQRKTKENSKAYKRNIQSNKTPVLGVPREGQSRMPVVVYGPFGGTHQMSPQTAWAPYLFMSLWVLNIPYFFFICPKGNQGRWAVFFSRPPPKKKHTHTHNKKKRKKNHTHTNKASRGGEKSC